MAAGMAADAGRASGTAPDGSKRRRETTAAPRVRLRVNPIECAAHGLCVELLPEWIELDDWGYPVLPERPLPAELMDHARRAIAACPTLALVLVADE